MIRTYTITNPEEKDAKPHLVTLSFDDEQDDQDTAKAWIHVTFNNTMGFFKRLITAIGFILFPSKFGVTLDSRELDWDQILRVKNFFHSCVVTCSDNEHMDKLATLAGIGDIPAIKAEKESAKIAADIQWRKNIEDQEHMVNFLKKRLENEQKEFKKEVREFREQVAEFKEQQKEEKSTNEKSE